MRVSESTLELLVQQGDRNAIDRLEHARKGRRVTAEFDSEGRLRLWVLLTNEMGGGR
jgi:hypothetical protein